MYAVSNITENVNVVIPMAGYGSRFTQAGYKDPKPFIPVIGERMISLVVKNIGIKAKYTFVIRKEFEDSHNASAYLETIAPGCNIVTVDKVTEGAACTVLLAKEYIDNDNPLVIVNSDQYIEFDGCENSYKFVFDFLHSPKEKELSGKISTFDGNRNPKWSYAKTDDSGIITEVREKDPFSENATTGLYMWRRGSDFVKYANQMITKNIRVNNEFYVVPVFNEAIVDGLKFGIDKCKKMWGLGVPDDLNIFLESRPPLKIAVCYSGEPRDFKNCFENHKKNIFQHHHIDTYVHMWECDETTTKATPDEVGINNEWRNNIPLITNLDYLMTMRPFSYIIEKRDMTPLTPQERQHKLKHGIRECVNMIHKNIKYDFVIRLRPDFFVLDKIDFNKILNIQDSVWLTVDEPTINDGFLWKGGPDRCTDFFAISKTSDVLLKYFSIVTHTADTPSGDSRFQIFSKNDITIHSLETQGHLYRNLFGHCVTKRVPHPDSTFFKESNPESLIETSEQHNIIIPPISKPRAKYIWNKPI
jgi:dTDP-glucose pyrophosphorylase